MFTALGSGPNTIFNAFIDCINRDIELGTIINQNKTREKIIETARLKYTNMEATSNWNKVEPCGTKLLVLTAQLSQQ